jgi:ankyrin repeat protein
MLAVKCFLLRGADVNGKIEDGMTALSWAAANGQEAIARLLLDKGALVDPHDVTGGTPLIQAAAQGHTQIVALLVARGADVRSRAMDDSCASRAGGGGN